MLSGCRAALSRDGYLITVLYSHRRVAMRIAATAAELASKDAVCTDDIELLAIELDELRGCVQANEYERPASATTTTAA
jgi:hypothetical protein